MGESLQPDNAWALQTKRRNLGLFAGLSIVAVVVLALATMPQDMASPTGSASAERPQPLLAPSRTSFVIGGPLALAGREVSLLDIVNSRNPAAFPGAILIRQARVQSVPSEQVFSIGPTPSNSILVKVEPSPVPGSQGESALLLRPGQAVAIRGFVQPISSFSEINKSYRVNPYEAGRLGNTSLLIRAESVQILD